jgi:hypothetical protein
MLVRCRCEHCAQGIEFESDDLTEENSIVPCPQCGLDTKLVIDSEGLFAMAKDNTRPFEERNAAFRAWSKATKPKRDAELKHMQDLVEKSAALVRQNEITAKIRSRDDELQLDGDKIYIRRRGVANALAAGLNGERTILISSLTAIQMKPGGVFSPGYILFSYAGSKPFMGGLIEATQDPDAFIFERALNDQVAIFKAKVENIVRVSKQASQSTASPATLADELRKLAELKQQGILSQEEFDVAKKKLLT